MKPLKGIVVNFYPERKFGFIKPDIARVDGKQLHFHINSGCMPGEKISGELELMLDTSIDDRPPCKGDHVVYYQHEKARGPQAFHWTYLSIWEAAEKQISLRPYPHHKLIRISLPLSDRPWQMKMVFEGFLGMLYRKYEEGELACLDNPIASIEERNIYSWDERPHPMNSIIGESRSGVSNEEYARMERYYLAHLIEEGVRFGEEYYPGRRFGTSVMHYAAIGRIGKVEGSHGLWGLVEKMPRVNLHILRSCAAASLFTGIDIKLFVWTCNAACDIGLKESAQYIAYYLRSDQSTQINDQTNREIDDYMKQVPQVAVTI
ncbi:MAG: hypothetical protein M3R25_10405 [Bacteroidota bacterium]|nr:hypothetical protein [Bacteroidota bacterium]